MPDPPGPLPLQIYRLHPPEPEQWKPEQWIPEQEIPEQWSCRLDTGPKELRFFDGMNVA